MDGFPFRIPIGEDEAHDSGILRAGGPTEDGGDVRFGRHENHGAFGNVAAAGGEKKLLPENAEQVADGDIDQSGEGEDQPAVGAAGVNGEEDEDQAGKNQHRLLDRLVKLNEVAPLDDIVHGVESDGHGEAEDEEEKADGAVWLVFIHAQRHAGRHMGDIDIIAEDEGILEGEGVDENKIKVFFPPETFSFIHFPLPALPVQCC